MVSQSTHTVSFPITVHCRREKYLDTLDAAAHRAQTMGGALAKWMQRQLAAGFNSWRAWYEDLMEQKAMGMKTMGFFLNRAIAAAWNSW